MAGSKVKTIESRLGPREIRRDKIIRFPRGVIGYEEMREFTLLQIRDESPLLVLQSLEDPGLGLLVADPYSFLPDYSPRVNDADQELLKAQKASDIAVLVTVSIPPGRPERTSLNLLGPIFINHKKRLGLQAPQNDMKGPAKFYVHQDGESE